MSRRPSSLFRGSELPRLLFLVAIVLAGWPMIVLFARPRADDKPSPPPLSAAGLAPVVADPGVEFQALLDKAPMRARENAAYALLLGKARDTPLADLARQARKDLFFTHLWERPERYRGVPVHLEGTALRVLTYEVNPALAPKGRIYEAWVYSDENRAFPYVVIFEDPPPGLAIGSDLHTRVRFDGYFLKLLGYRAGDKLRAAPMLVGRLRATPPQPDAPPAMVELRNFSKRDGFVLVFVLLLAYIAVRAFFQLRRALAPRRALKSRPAPSEGVPPEQVADWLQNLDEPDDDAEVAPERDRAKHPGPG